MEKGAQIVAISPDSAAISAAFAKELGVTYPILVDADQAVIRAYRVQDERTDTAWPTVFVVDPSGHVAFVDSAKTKNIEGRTKPQAILSALSALSQAP